MERRRAGQGEGRKEGGVGGWKEGGRGRETRRRMAR